jgi:hypothetical protein
MTAVTVTINCDGVTVEFGSQLAGILTHVLRRRLDLEIVIPSRREQWCSGRPRAAEPDEDQGEALVHTPSQ